MILTSLLLQCFNRSDSRFGKKEKHLDIQYFEIKRKLQAFEKGLKDLKDWDRKTHPGNPVIKSINPIMLIKNSKNFLIHQKKSGLRLLPYLIAVAGGTASGKTFITESFVKDSFPKEFKKHNAIVQEKIAGHITSDNYYRNYFSVRKTMGDVEFLKKTNLDEPAALTMGKLQQTIMLLKKGITVFTPHVDFTNSKRTEKACIVTAYPFILVDGLFALNGKSFLKNVKKPFCNLFDLKIFVDTDRKTVIKRWWQRAASRNVKHDSAGNALLNNSLAMHDTHVAPSKNNADIVINGSAQTKEIKATLKRLTHLLLKTFYP